MAELALSRFPSKRIVFTAPTAPLVEQQMKYFAAELHQEASTSGSATIRIGGHFGGKNRGDRNANVLFFTPAKLVEFLRRPETSAMQQSTLRGGTSMETISLLIVDECHHTRGASPLTTVAELYAFMRVCVSI